MRRLSWADWSCVDLWAGEGLLPAWFGFCDIRRRRICAFHWPVPSRVLCRCIGRGHVPVRGLRRSVDASCVEKSKYAFGWNRTSNLRIRRRPLLCAQKGPFSSGTAAILDHSAFASHRKKWRVTQDFAVAEAQKRGTLAICGFLLDRVRDTVPLQILDPRVGHIERRTATLSQPTAASSVPYEGLIVSCCRSQVSGRLRESSHLSQ